MGDGRSDLSDCVPPVRVDDCLGYVGCALALIGMCWTYLDAVELAQQGGIVVAIVPGADDSLALYAVGFQIRGVPVEEVLMNPEVSAYMAIQACFRAREQESANA